MKKSILIFLTTLWVAVMVITKFSDGMDLLFSKNRSLPLKLFLLVMKSLKSVILFLLIALNAFMAISLIDNNKNLNLNR